MQSIYERLYKPDVLSCLADLSNDEVFTPPDVANKMLDLLPQELFKNKETKILDPACKSGVILREAAKRFIEGERDQFDSLQECIDWVFHNQIYGIAITELTSLLSRRSVYCSKYPNSPFSITKFDKDDVQGNILFHRIQHTWEGLGEDKKCSWCGASMKEYKRSEDLETHAYEWIHTNKPEEIWDMKFDVVISNPPYQLSTGGGTQNTAKQARPIYHHFVEQAKKLNPRYISMIIPSRWFAGGMGLEGFRKGMMSDHKITTLVDYPNAKDCFPQNSISGGVCYFLWSRDSSGNNCHVVNISGAERNELDRPLDEFDTLVRYNKAIEIIRKIRAQSEYYLNEMTSAISPFGLNTKTRGTVTKTKDSDIVLYSSNGKSYIPYDSKFERNKLFDCYKVMVSQTSAEHAGEPGKDGTFRVLTSSMKVIGPKEVCTHSYVVLGPLDKEKAQNVWLYLQTKFVRFLCLQMLTSIHISKSTFSFVPVQDFSRPWTDDELYKKYDLTDDEIAFIEAVIKPIEFNGGDK